MVQARHCSPVRFIPQISLLALIALSTALAAAEIDPTPSRAPQLPHGHQGIASRNPGDAGIVDDPRVIFAENFESSSLEELTRRWEDVGELESMSFSGEVPEHSSGHQSLLMDRQRG